ncbi:MAG TPA: ribonuclease Z [Cytophaga sp.]|jgi:ribonuclease Z|nr:ribonuclease Z [Cytophaga sp.]
MDFELTVLGSSSATPSKGRYQSAQLLKIHNEYFMIDCGEAAQYQLSRYKLNHTKISHIFISHLHGDHFFGLIGLLSTMNLYGRKNPLHIFAPAGLDEIIQIQLKYSETILQFPLYYTALDSKESQLIVNHPLIDVYTIPLEHRIHCNGFLFKEKSKSLKLNKEKLPEGLSLQEIAQLKQGINILDEEGNIKVSVTDCCLPALKSRSYAYCSDTRFTESILPLIKGVDLLYHESTFLDELSDRAAKTYHSTAKQAAMIASKAQVGKLVIGHFSSRYYDIEPFMTEAGAIFKNTALGIEGSTFSISDRNTTDETNN